MIAVLDICHHLLSEYFENKLTPGCLLNEASYYNGNNGDRTEVYVGAGNIEIYFF